MPPKKDTKDTAEHSKHAVEITAIVFFIYLVWALFQRLQQYLIYSNTGSFAELWARFMAYFVAHILPIVVILGVLVVLLSILGLIYNWRQIEKINEEEKLQYGLAGDMVGPIEEDNLRNEKWESVLKNINSLNASDWKLAILDADNMLDELLKVAGYHGDSLGEMLKSVEKSDFVTLDAAWEAHKVRNQIAHQGIDFVLNQREAKGVIALYERVFKEFKII